MLQTPKNLISSSVLTCMQFVIYKIVDKCINLIYLSSNFLVIFILFTKKPFQNMNGSYLFLCVALFFHSILYSVKFYWTDIYKRTGLNSGMLIAVPIPDEFAATGEIIQSAIDEAVESARFDLKVSVIFHVVFSVNSHVR